MELVMSYNSSVLGTFAGKNSLLPALNQCRGDTASKQNHSVVLISYYVLH